MIVIEMNPRVSRSSALASKATGFPTAKIAAKLAVGYTLDEIRNDITRETPASFEPTIDYCVVKVPRFTFEKFPQADATLTTQMKSVGEAMAIGRTFKEALQKALRSLEIKRFGVIGWSAGGPHALAVAATAPVRVSRVALVGSMPPADGVAVLPRDVQRLMRVARVAPWLAARGLERWGRSAPPPTGNAATDEAYARGRVESFRAGGLWLARELAYLGRPWGFELDEVRAPVTLWWGERDHVCPPSIAGEYARRLPDATLRLVDDTHQLLFSRWREILADVSF